MEEAEESLTIAPRRWTWVAIPAIAFEMLANITDAVSDAFSTASCVAVAHINYLDERRQFEQRTALAIETITNDG